MEQQQMEKVLTMTACSDDAECQSRRKRDMTLFYVNYFRKAKVLSISWTSFFTETNQCWSYQFLNRKDQTSILNPDHQNYNFKLTFSVALINSSGWSSCSWNFKAENRMRQLMIPLTKECQGLSKHIYYWLKNIQRFFSPSNN